ncbi:hypothetical protein DVH05_024778 [Phytophthora capsici]|nr:hypothetical protein DVH05_024778 [Phytophthora capsici]
MMFLVVHCVIEIKKNPSEATERRKLFLKLVLADLKSDVASAPIGLLTNLNDYWYFMWFTTDRKIMRMKLSCPANGFKAMKDFLTETFDVIKKESPGRQTGIYPMRFLSSPLPKRQKLIQPAPTAAIAAAEMMERYELMVDVLPPEFLLEKRMEFHLLMLHLLVVSGKSYQLGQLYRFAFTTTL